MIKELSNNLPSADEIIRALGMQTRRSQNDVMPSIALFGAGILVGAGLALLFAPTTGRELREGLGEKASAMAEGIAGAADEAIGGNGRATA